MVIMHIDPPTTGSTRPASLTLLYDGRFYHILISPTNFSVYHLDAAHLGRLVPPRSRVIYERPLTSDVETEFAAVLADPAVTVMEALLSREVHHV